MVDWPSYARRCYNRSDSAHAWALVIVQSRGMATGPNGDGGMKRQRSRDIALIALALLMVTVGLPLLTGIWWLGLMVVGVSLVGSCAFSFVLGLAGK